ncbi:MAG: hypothetical protein CM1200mP6_06480 [Anaerolineaceae bacterium]|nr:MAG: hypothetical protein CM1200mP6_06480 [Anaerolineaceae bacterium]
MNFLVVQETDWIQRGPHQQHHLFERLSKMGHKVVVLDFEINYTPWPYAPLVAPRLICEQTTRTDTEANICVIRPSNYTIAWTSKDYIYGDLLHRINAYH